MTELERLQAENAALRNDMEFQIHHYTHLMELHQTGIARHLRERLSLELSAIRETAFLLEDGDKLRILRRLDRIEKILGGIEK